MLEETGERGREEGREREREREGKRASSDVGGGGSWVNIGWLCAAGLQPILVYFVAHYRPH